MSLSFLSEHLQRYINWCAARGLSSMKHAILYMVTYLQMELIPSYSERRDDCAGYITRPQSFFMSLVENCIFPVFNTIFYYMKPHYLVCNKRLLWLVTDLLREIVSAMDIYADLPSANTGSDASGSSGSSSSTAPSSTAPKGSWAHSKFQGMIAKRRTATAVSTSSEGVQFTPSSHATEYIFSYHR